MVPPKIWRAFQVVGLDFETRGEPYMLRFNEKKLSESDVLLGSVGSTSPKRMTEHPYISVSFVIDRSADGFGGFAWHYILYLKSEGVSILLLTFLSVDHKFKSPQ
jgi:hypothetical protein